MSAKVRKLRGRKKAFLLAYLETYPRMSIAEACEQVGVTRDAYYKWRLRDPNFVKALEYALEEFDDKIEGWLREIMKHGDPKLRLDSIKYYADRKLKDRGYGQKHEITGAGGKPLQIQVIDSFQEQGEPASDDRGKAPDEDS